MSECPPGAAKILVVDDSFIMRKLVREIVESDPALRVVDTAEDGRVALQKVRQLKPDLVLLDIEMPEMSGLETLRRLGLRSPVKVVILSSLAGEDTAERVEALRLGAAAAIAKPSGSVSLDLRTARGSEIVRTVRRVLGMSEVAGDTGAEATPLAPGAVGASDAALLAALLRGVPAGVLGFASTGRLMHVNETARALLRQPDLAPGRVHLGDVFDDFNAPLADSVREVLATGLSVADHVVDYADANGDFLPLRLTVDPLPVADGTSGALMLLRDDTERQQLRRQLERTGSAAGAETLMAGGEAAAGTLRRTTILFSDVRGFTTLSEELGAAGVVALLNEYFSWMADVIRGEGGTIDKFIGDAIMALFGSPIARDDDPKRAVRAALAMLNALDMLNADRAAQGRSLLEIGIGLATGEVIAGQIGSPDRLNYTVIGDAVNLAARLEARTKDYGVPLLTCGVTAGELGLEVPRRLIDVVRVKGQSNPAEVHEILRLPASDADTRAWLRPFEAGMAAYRSGDFSAAIALLDTALIARPEDRPAALLRERCGLLLASRPGRWDGVWTLTEK